jgi:hypothetical protein
MGKTAKKKVRKEGKNRKKGEGTKWEGSMGKTTRKKGRKEGQKRKSNIRKRRN